MEQETSKSRNEHEDKSLRRAFNTEYISINNAQLKQSVFFFSVLLKLNPVIFAGAK